MATPLADIYDCMRSGCSFIPEVGSLINVNEKFIIRFWVSNISQDNHIAFINGLLWVAGTANAKPVAGDKFYALQRLGHGESTTKDVEFIALKSFGIPPVQEIAKSFVALDLDPNSYFKTFIQYVGVFGQIFPPHFD